MPRTSSRLPKSSASHVVARSTSSRAPDFSLSFPCTLSEHRRPRSPVYRSDTSSVAATDDRRGTIHERMRSMIDRGLPRRSRCCPFRESRRPRSRRRPTASGRPMAATSRTTGYSPLDQITAEKLQRARARLAVQHRQLRPPARDELPVDAADGQRHPLRHRGVAPRGRRPRRRDRRAAVDAPRRRGRARRVRRRAGCPDAGSRTGTTAATGSCST